MPEFDPTLAGFVAFLVFVIGGGATAWLYDQVASRAPGALGTWLADAGVRAYVLPLVAATLSAGATVFLHPAEQLAESDLAPLIDAALAIAAAAVGWQGATRAMSRGEAKVASA